MGPAIEVMEVSKRFKVPAGFFRFDTVTALSKVSLTVAEGEAVALIGPNGSGKSTLLAILSGILKPSSGSVRVGGVSPHGWEKPPVGVVPERAWGFAGRLDARQNLEFFAALQNVPPRAARGRVEELLERVGLSSLGRKPFWTFSAGQRRRLNLARAMIHDPPILLLDEPMKGLDPWIAGELRGWIREHLVAGRRKTVVLSTNQPSDVREICGRAYLLKEGAVAWEGPANAAPVAQGAMA